MAEFSKLVITQKGQVLITKTIAGTASSIEFTNIASSSCKYELGELEELTNLSNIEQISTISNIKIKNDDVVELRTSFVNTDLIAGYYMRTLGVYALDPDDGEILFALTVETTGNCYMPAPSTTVSGALITLSIKISNAQNISLEVNPSATATIADIDELQELINTLNQNVSAHTTQINTLNQKALITKAKLAAGATSITITDSRISANSTLSFYTSEYGVDPTAVSVAAGSVTLTFDEQTAAITVGVKVEG